MKQLPNISIVFVVVINGNIKKNDYIFYNYNYYSMNNIDIIPGLITGILSGIIFNPIDKAIYISSTKDLNIYNKNIWLNIFKGLKLTLLTRIITTGFYFSFIDNNINKLNNLELSIYSSLLCSLTNPLQLIKFNSWYNNISYKETYNYIIKKYGYKGLFIGIIPLLSRDIIFNYIYLNNRKKDNHLYNLLVISSAFIISSPINLIKNKKYSSNEDIKSIIKNFKFNQLGISYSLLRISISFYTSQYIYDKTKY